MSTLQNDGNVQGVIEAELCTNTEDIRLFALGQDIIKNSIPLLNDILSKMLTLNTAMIGGGIAAAKADVMSPQVLLPSIATFLVALVLTLAGMLPWTMSVDMSRTEIIAELERSTRKRKLWCLYLSAGLFILGMLMAVVGTAAHRF